MKNCKTLNFILKKFSKIKARPAKPLEPEPSTEPSLARFHH